MRTYLILILTSVCLSAVEGGASIAPAPGFEPPKGGSPRGLPPMMTRPAATFEVEQLELRRNNVGDLAAWAELASQGYHVVAAVPSGDATVLFLERTGQPPRLQLPAAIEKEPAVAEPLRARIQAALAERMQALRPQPMPAPVAPVAPTPAPATK